MVKQTVALQGQHHMKRISEIVQEAGKFQSAITLYTPAYNKEINVKSILGLLSLPLQKGEQVILSATGIDEQEALATIASKL